MGICHVLHGSSVKAKRETLSVPSSKIPVPTPAPMTLFPAGARPDLPDIANKEANILAFFDKIDELDFRQP